jgi:hypothetical protein
MTPSRPSFVLRALVLQPVVVLALVACGASGSEEIGGAEPDVALPEGVVAGPNDVDIASEGSEPPDLDDEAVAEEVRSTVNVWRFSNRDMSTRFVHYFDPSSGPSGSVSLMYGARGGAGQSIELAWLYEGQEVEYSYDMLTVAPSYVGFRDEAAQREWRVSAGDVSLVPLADGRVRVNLVGLEIVELVGADEGPAEPIADGFVVGDVERVCVEYVIPTEDVVIDGSTGLPAPQSQRDDDWSSPYCAQFAP